MGERKMADISVMDAERLCGWLPRRARETHKGDFGRILLLCGAVGYTGAPALAAMGAARSGAGLIFVGVPEPVYPIVAGKLLEPMVFPLPAQGGMLAESAVPEILARLSGCDACLIGCGMGRSAGTFAAVQAVLANASCPVVVDADGINVLEGHIDVLRGAACPVVLTPHDGEYRRLMGRLPGEDRMGAAAALAKKTGATVLLKGHRTAICGADERWENRCGNPGLATGGSGDVLAGILVSLLGQGLPPVHAAAAAAWLHGTAADRCAARMGEYGLLPSDVAAELPYLLPSEGLRVRRGCAVLMMCLCLLLGGCGGRSQGVSPAIAFRASLVQAGGCSFRAELTADYGDYVVPFTLDCETEVNGPTHFTVAAPETLAGITAAVDETGGTVTYDGLMMDFGLLANGRLAPAAGPAVVAYCWSSAYLAAGGEEDGRFRATYEKDYEEKMLKVDTWFENGIPIYAEVCYNGQRILNLTISEFSLK